MIGILNALQPPLWSMNESLSNNNGGALVVHFDHSALKGSITIESVSNSTHKSPIAHIPKISIKIPFTRGQLFLCSLFQ